MFNSGDSLAKSYMSDNLEEDDDDNEDDAYAYRKHGTESADCVDDEEHNPNFAAGFRM